MNYITRSFQIISFLLFSLLQLNGQDTLFKQPIVSLEMGGNTGYYSVNGEFKLLNINKIFFTSRIGIGYAPSGDIDYIGVHVAVNIFSGVRNSHPELGLGLSYLKGQQYYKYPVENKYVYYPTEVLYFVPSLSYRLDNPAGGIIFKARFSPLLAIHDFFNRDDYINNIISDTYKSSGYNSEKEYRAYLESIVSEKRKLKDLYYIGFVVGYRFKQGTKK